VQRQISHSTTNGKLPSFHHPKLAEVRSELDLVADCWDLLRGEAKTRHLPKEQGEPEEAYKGRVRRSSYPSFFKDGITAFAGVLSRYELRGVQQSLIEAQADINGEGDSLKAWGMVADSLVLRDGGCLLMCDMPQGTAESRAAEIAQGRRPVFSIAERSNVLNWKLQKIGRKHVPIAITVLEWHEVDDDDYGIKLEPRYRVMSGGNWQLIKINGGDKGKDNGEGTIEVLEEDRFIGAGGRDLEYPPVIWYGPPRDGFGAGAPMLLSLANLTLDWFREYSDLKELLHRCALPVTVLKDAGRVEGTPLTLGPNSLVEIKDPNGSLTFAEPTGSSLDKHLQHLAEIEKLIDRSTLSFLFSSGSGQRTATQAELESAQLQASITSLAEAKSSCWQSLFDLWGTFTGDLPEVGAGIDLLPGITDKPVDDALLTLAGTLFDKGLLMRETVTNLAQRRGMLRPGVNGEDEAAQLAEEDEKQNALLNPPVPGPNDLAEDDEEEPVEEDSLEPEDQ
jgi:hypothetical protein